MTKTEKTVHTCIVVVDVIMDHDTVILGAIADSVQEVIKLDPVEIEPTPEIGATLNTAFIKGMGEHNERFNQNILSTCSANAAVTTIGVLHEKKTGTIGQCHLWALFILFARH